MGLHPRTASARVRAVVLLATAAVASISGAANADAVPLVRSTFAVRGAPMLIPVQVTPDALVGLIEFVSGPSGSRQPGGGRLIWRMPVPLRDDDLVRWAASSRNFTFATDRPDGATEAFLAIDVPASLPDRARVDIAGVGVGLSVFDAGPADLYDQIALRASMLTPLGEPDALLTLPDHALPFERFRYDIGVPMRGWPRMQAFDPGSGNDLASRAVSALWRAAIWRVMASSPGPAIELAEQLVASCSDSTARAPIAAWIADERELVAILDLVLDRELSAQGAANRIDEFLRHRTPVLWWVEDSDRTSVTIALANPTTRAQLVRFVWLVGSESDMVVRPETVQPAEVLRVRIARPTVAVNVLGAEQDERIESLRVEFSTGAKKIDLPKGTQPSEPQGFELKDFFAPLNLVTVSGEDRTPPEPVGGSYAALRPRLAGWELFVEARTAATLAEASNWIAAYGPAGRMIRIDALGAVTKESCDDLAPDAVEFAHFPDRFRGGFVVPSGWTKRTDDATIIEVGFRRAWRAGFVDAPFPTVPWRSRPRTQAIDIMPRE